jgi:thymidylate synthase
MRVYNGETFADVYKDILSDVLLNPEYITSPRGMLIHEVTNAAFVINNPKSCLYLNDRRGSQLKYIAAELVWYFAGRNDVKFISTFAKFWEYLDNGDGTVNSAYGNLIFNLKDENTCNQYQWALSSLVKDKDSRQAILHFNRPIHQKENNKDFVCTLNGIFQIRNNRLNFTIDMRSNDLVLGTPTDIAFFCLLQEQMLAHLKLTYPDLELGTYTQLSHSLHIYEKHFNLITDMLNCKFTPSYFPPILKSLIDTDGQPTNMIRDLEEEIINNKQSSLIKTDNLQHWISNLIFE